jgi:Cu/Ag efflux protein CusF
MKKLLALSLSFLLVVLLGTLTFANAPEKKAGKMDGEKKPAAKAGMHQFTGKVTNWSPTEVTVEKGGKMPKTETFTIDDKTTKPADVKVGDQVTVHYKEDGGKKLATKITAKGAAAPKGGAKKPAAKKSEQ